MPADDVLERLGRYFGVTPAFLRYGEGGETGARLLDQHEPQRPVLPQHKRGGEK